MRSRPSCREGRWGWSDRGLEGNQCDRIDEAVATLAGATSSSALGRRSTQYQPAQRPIGLATRHRSIARGARSISRRFLREKGRGLKPMAMLSRTSAMEVARRMFLPCLMLGIAPALADERPAATDRMTGSMAEAERTCREWTDGCSVCLRRDDSAFDCSLPGIACQPAPVVCRVPMASRAGADAHGRKELR